MAYTDVPSAVGTLRPAAAPRLTVAAPQSDRRHALKYLHSICALVIASLMVPAVALALMADSALAAEPQMPEEFQGNWCAEGDFPKGDGATNQVKEGADCRDWSSVEITATGIKNRTFSISCVIHKVTKFDVCPWGMIFRNRKRAQALRSFQINPWSPGYRIVLQCTGGPKRSVDWAIEKGSIRAVSRDYRCPWDRRGARLR
jgi:hypothetical protein